MAGWLSEHGVHRGAMCDAFLGGLTSRHLLPLVEEVAPRSLVQLDSL